MISKRMEPNTIMLGYRPTPIRHDTDKLGRQIPIYRGQDIRVRRQGPSPAYAKRQRAKRMAGG